MKKKADIPFHSYNEAVAKVQHADRMPHQPSNPQFPFLFTKFELMKALNQADYAHRHDCYEVLYICEGAGTHIIDFEPYPIQPPMFFFLSKDQVHYWDVKKPLKGYALLFPEEFIALPSSSILRTHDFAFFHQVGQMPCLSVVQENLTVINGLFAGIEQEYHHENARSLSSLRSYLHILLTQLNRLYTSNHSDKHSVATSSLVYQFERLVSEHFITDHSAQDYAEKIGVNTNHLTDTIKAETGYTPGQLIRQKLILEAKRLLVHSPITVAEIGYRLNFEDSSYFGRFFKRETGMSPLIFRQQTREQYQVNQD